MNIKKYLSLILLLSPFFQLSATTLTIGTIGYNPPFELRASEKGGFVGFEIALMKEICKRIQSNCEFKNALFLDLGSMINTGEVDLAIAAIVITAERQKKFLFSEPYKPSYLQFVVSANSPAKTLQDLRGKKLALYLDAPSRALVLKQFNNNIQLMAYSNSMEMLSALNKNEVNALITNHSQAQYWIANDSACRLLGPKLPVGEGYGIMAKLGRDSLIRKINQALKDMEQDGTYLKIYNQSF